MIYAIDEQGVRRRAIKEVPAECPVCGARVIAKIGKIVVPHWAHEASSDCDPWAEPETPWHLGWKERFPEDMREVVVGPHRADIHTGAAAIEFQHSSISADMVRERERYYRNMIWVVDVRDKPWIERRMDYGVLRVRWPHRPSGWKAARMPVLIDDGSGQLVALEWKKYHEIYDVYETYEGDAYEKWRRWDAEGSLVPYEEFVEYVTSHRKDVR